jgi:hypothetical protein
MFRRRIPWRWRRICGCLSSPWRWCQPRGVPTRFTWVSTRHHRLIKYTDTKAFVFLKVVCYEKLRGTGGWPLFEDGFGPWRPMSVCFLICRCLFFNVFLFLFCTARLIGDWHEDRQGQKRMYLFLNYRRNEEKWMHSSLNYPRSKEFTPQIEGTKKSNVFTPKLSKERRKSNLITPQLLKERKKIE